MIESSVIDRLNPLKSEKLLILAEPQRMNRASAKVVDGSAKENGEENDGDSNAVTLS